jgi:hypothetical protein
MQHLINDRAAAIGNSGELADDGSRLFNNFFFQTALGFGLWLQ